MRGQVYAAHEYAVDESPDDAGPVHGRVPVPTALPGEPIQVLNLPLEEDHGDLGPRFRMHSRTAGPLSFDRYGSAFRWARPHDRKMVAGLLPAQRHPFAHLDRDGA